MIITCPHCQTRYQVTYEAIGSTGRKVQCAHCQQAWSQKPLDPDAFDDGDPLVRNVARRSNSSPITLTGSPMDA